MLRQRNYNVKILFAGGGDGEAQKMLDAVIAEVDPNCNFIEQIEFVSHSKVPSLLADADIFIFASSCENMPNTLVEAMSSGLPIACSNRGPMPEVLACGGEFFDPENPVTIANAVEKIISNKDYRIKIKKIAKELSEKYSWAKCGHDTWNYLKCVADKHHCSKK
jgi:glycosyltransferase involved in cell wall biosynthesis